MKEIYPKITIQAEFIIFLKVEFKRYREQP